MGLGMEFASCDYLGTLNDEDLVEVEPDRIYYSRPLNSLIIVKFDYVVVINPDVS